MTENMTVADICNAREEISYAMVKMKSGESHCLIRI